MPLTYVLIGGSHGIGLELARQLSAQQHRVLVFSRTQGDLAALPAVEWHRFDVLRDTLDAALLPEVVHGLAYCPGSINLRGFATLKPEQFRDELELNCIGAVRCIQAALKALKASGNASILLFSTVAVGVGMPFHASIAAAKGAVEGLTRALAAELAPAVRVNCIAPSLTDTPLAERLLSSDEKRAAAAARHPLRRVGTAAELAALGVFLLSEQAGWITGQIVAADGGLGALRV